MLKFHAIMGGFCGDFPVDISADSIESAIDILNESYEESSVLEIGDNSYWNGKESDAFSRAAADYATAYRIATTTKESK